MTQCSFDILSRKATQFWQSIAFSGSRWETHTIRININEIQTEQGFCPRQSIKILCSMCIFILPILDQLTVFSSSNNSLIATKSISRGKRDNEYSVICKLVQTRQLCFQSVCINSSISHCRRVDGRALCVVHAISAMDSTYVRQVGSTPRYPDGGGTCVVASDVCRWDIRGYRDNTKERAVSICV